MGFGIELPPLQVSLEASTRGCIHGNVRLDKVICREKKLRFKEAGYRAAIRYRMKHSCIE